MLAVTSPVIHAAMPNSVPMMSATVLACTALPVKKLVIMSAPAKKTASGFQFSPSPLSM